MAINTDISLRSKMIYQVFVRQHSTKGNFAGVVEDLDRIKAMGTDIIYLLPIHPIGRKDRKGSIGSPYSIQDHMAIDPAYGTLGDFDRLVSETRKRGMKLMIDIVINHTSRDSVLTKTHPEWFYRKTDGTFANRVGDWSDITDLDYQIPMVRGYFKDVLRYWALHVDGFRCDVAPMLPMDFWRDAKEAISLIKPDFIWLSESVHLSFVKYLRDQGFDCASDSMIFDVFDIAYDYDIFDFMDDYLKHPDKLSRWLQEIMRQESVYPKNYVKLRSFENHDQMRLMSKVRNETHFRQMLALSFFIKGTPMVYAGMEHMDANRPDLFEHDPVRWNHDASVEDLIYKLAQLKKDPIFTKGVFNLIPDEKAAILTYTSEDDYLVGVFNLEGATTVDVGLVDGIYESLLGNNPVTIKNSSLTPGVEPLIIRTGLANRR